MASNYTENIGLCQWAAEDAVLREDFNADNLKIDQALQTKTGLHLGSYTGTTPFRESGSQDIVLGFRPKFVFVWVGKAVQAVLLDAIDETRGVAADGFPYGDLLVITDTGFTVASKMDVDNTHIYPRLNTAGTEYFFAAFH